MSLLHREPRPSGPPAGIDDSGTAAYTFFLGICVFLLIGALSTRQVTAPGPATDILASGIASLSEVDLVLAQHGDELREIAAASNQSSVTVPGYPLDVYVTRQEAATLSNAQLRDLLLERSAAIVYAEGLGAFDRTGSQQLSFFSPDGLMEQAAGTLSEKQHGHANAAAIVLALLTALAAVLVVLRNSGFKRMRQLGIATVMAAIPGFTAAWLAGRAVTALGGDDPLRHDLRDIILAVSRIPERNYLVALAAGIVITLTAAGFALALRYLPLPSETPYDDGYDDVARRRAEFLRRK
ncbi:MAG: hypothetical protein U0547_03990 [Dehalococcoidia bacterium]